MITANLQTEVVEAHPVATLIDTRNFEFACDDDRLANREQVTLVVANCNSPDDAKHILRKFLSDVETHGLRID